MRVARPRLRAGWGYRIPYTTTQYKMSVESLLQFSSGGLQLLARLRRVVPRAVPYPKIRHFGDPVNGHLDPPELGVGKALGGIVGQQILRSQFVTDLAKGAV